MPLLLLCQLPSLQKALKSLLLASMSSSKSAVRWPIQLLWSLLWPSCSKHDTRSAVCDSMQLLLSEECLLTDTLQIGRSQIMAS